MNGTFIATMNLKTSDNSNRIPNIRRGNSTSNYIYKLIRMLENSNVLESRDKMKVLYENAKIELEQLRGENRVLKELKDDLIDINFDNPKNDIVKGIINRFRLSDEYLELEQAKKDLATEKEKTSRLEHVIETQKISIEELEKSLAAKTTLKTDLDSSQKEIKALNKRIEELEDNARTNEELTTTIESLKSQNESLNRIVSEKNREIELLNRDYNQQLKNTKDEAGLSVREAEFDRDYHLRNADIENRQKQLTIDEQQFAINNAGEIINEGTNQLASAQQSIYNLQSELESARQTIFNLQNELESAGMNNREASQAVANLQGQLEAANQEIANLQGQLQSANQEITNLQGQLQSLESISQENNYLRGQLQSANQEIASLQGQLQSANQEIASLQGQLEAINREASQTVTNLQNENQALNNQIGIQNRFIQNEINHERYGDNFAGQRLRMNVGGKRQTGEKALAELISLFDE